MIKKFLAKKMMKMKGVPEEQQEMLLALMEKDPELFKNMQDEIKALTDGGMNDFYASQKVALKYKDRLQKLMSN